MKRITRFFKKLVSPTKVITLDDAKDILSKLSFDAYVDVSYQVGDAKSDSDGLRPQEAIEFLDANFVPSDTWYVAGTHVEEEGKQHIEMYGGKILYGAKGKKTRDDPKQKLTLDYLVKKQ